MSLCRPLVQANVSGSLFHEPSRWYLFETQLQLAIAYLHGGIGCTCIRFRDHGPVLALLHMQLLQLISSPDQRTFV